MSKSQSIYNCLGDAKNCRSVIGDAFRELDYRSVVLIENGLFAKEEAMSSADAFVDRHKTWGNQKAVAAAYAVFTEIADDKFAKANPSRSVVCTGASMILNRCTAHVE